MTTITTNQNTPTTTDGASRTVSRGTTINGSAAALWASAFVIIAFIIVQAGRLPGNQAMAGVASERGSYTLLTASTGIGPEARPDDALFVLDSRDQVLLVYDIENISRKQITLRDGGSLENLFVRARQ